MKKHGNHSVLRWSALLLISVLILGTFLLSAFAAETAETRYTTDGGATWTEATFKDALAAGVAAEKTTIELLGNYTLSQVFTVTGGDITIKSIDGQTYTVTKSTESEGDIFTVSGGAKITLANIKFEGGGKWSSPLGSLFRLSTKDDTVILESGTTVNGFYVNGSGSVVNAPNGYVEMKDGVTITNCTAKYSGGAFSIGVASGTGEGAVLNMTGGTISGCAVNNLSNGVHTGSAVAVFKNATFNMSGGLITNCESLRTSAASSHATGAIIDGAVGMKDGPHTVTISGDAVIRDNRAYRWNGTDKELSSGADVVHNRGYQNAASLVIAKDFTGSIGAANAYSVATTAAETVAFATAGEGWNAGDIIHGVIDNN
ncbi:MAG: hypothetical protein J6B12_06090, partial [Clostridia bacterium]|nr:hypothetical protein [Clostridia bacterium]